TGFEDGRYFKLARRFARSSAPSADARRWPTSDGTVTDEADVVVALVVVVRAVVVVAVVVVVVAAGAPFETFSRTAVPWSTFVPAAGLCATTVPFGLLDATCATFASSPAPLIVATAFCCVWPTTFGTATFAAPFETPIVTAEPGGA